MSKCDNEQWGLCNFPACPGDCPGRGNEFAIQSENIGRFLPVAVPYDDTLGSMPYIEPYDPVKDSIVRDAVQDAIRHSISAVPSRKYEPYNAMQEAIKDPNMVTYNTISVTISKVGVGKSIFKKGNF